MWQTVTKIFERNIYQRIQQKSLNLIHETIAANKYRPFISTVNPPQLYPTNRSTTVSKKRTIHRRFRYRGVFHSGARLTVWYSSERLKKRWQSQVATNARQFWRREGHRVSKNAGLSANFNQQDRPQRFRRTRRTAGRKIVRRFLGLFPEEEPVERTISAPPVISSEAETIRS